MIMSQGATINRLSAQIDELLAEIQKLTAGGGSPAGRAIKTPPATAKGDASRNVTFVLGDDKGGAPPKSAAAAKATSGAKIPSPPVARHCRRNTRRRNRCLPRMDGQ